MKAAYDRLYRAKSLEYLNFIRAWRLNTIECTIEGEEKRYGFGWYPLKPKTMGLADYTFLRDNNNPGGLNMNEAFIAAGFIVHEAFHVYRFESGRKPTGMDIDFDLEKTFWGPQQASDYKIWTFAINALDSLQVLSPVRTFNYTALPEDMPTDINTKTEGSEERRQTE